MKKLMTTKTKLGIFTVAGIVALASFASVIMFDELQPKTTTQTEVIQDLSESEPFLENAVPLYLQTNRAGLPVIDAIEIENPRLDNLDFQELRVGEFDFIWRAIENGATYVSDKELQTYYEQLPEPKHRFIIKDGDSVKYYRTAISTPPLSYDLHYIKVLEYGEPRDNISFKTLDEQSKASIDIESIKPYRWISIDEIDATSLKEMMNQKGTFFTAITERGQSNFQIQYLGPLGEEFNNADFIEMRGSDNLE